MKRSSLQTRTVATKMIWWNWRGRWSAVSLWMKRATVVFQESQGANFINMFTQSFSTHISQKCKKDNQVKQLFALLGSMRLKAERKHIDEIDPRCKEDSDGNWFSLKTVPIVLTVWQSLELKPSVSPNTTWGGKGFSQSVTWQNFWSVFLAWLLTANFQFQNKLRSRMLR